MIGVVWKGRAGQGIVTNANLLSSAAIDSKLQAKSFPSFGGERLGAPVNSFTYIDEQVIHLHCIVQSAEVVSIVDPYFVHKVNILSSLKEGGVLIVNVSDSYSDRYLLDSIRMSFEHDHTKSSNDMPHPSKIYRVDAQAHASRFFQRGQGQNIVILGATFKVMEDLLRKFPQEIKPDAIQHQIDLAFRKKIGTQKTLDNLSLFQIGFENAREVSTEALSEN